MTGAIPGRGPAAASPDRGQVPLWLLWATIVAVQATQALMAARPGAPTAALAAAEVAIIGLSLTCVVVERARYRRSIEAFNASESQLQETRRRLTVFNEHMHALHEFTHQLVEAEDTAQLGSLVTSTLVDAFLFDSCQLWVRDAATGTLRCVSRSGYPEAVEREVFGRGGEGSGALVEFLTAVMDGGQPVVVGQASDERARTPAERSEFVRALGASSCVVMGLYDEHRPIGVLSAERRADADGDASGTGVVRSASQAAMSAIAGGERQRPEDADRELVETVQTVVETALVKMELFRTMEQQIEQRTAELRSTRQAVREAKEMVVQSEKLSSLGRMAAGVIHEINDPLNFMVNILPDVRRDLEVLARARLLILSAVTDPAPRSEMERISREADLESHLQDMDFVFTRALEAVQKSARIARGLQVFATPPEAGSAEEVDLLASARDAVDLVPGKIRGQTEIVVTHVPGVTWRVSRSQFEQVIMALLTNAIDAMDQRGRITICGRRTAEGVEVSVSDTGPGVPEPLRSRIFDPFFTTKPAGKGTGLGLSIATEIVRKFGGHVSVDSPPGGGAVFKVAFRPPPGGSDSGASPR